MQDEPVENTGDYLVELSDYLKLGKANCEGFYREVAKVAKLFYLSELCDLAVNCTLTNRIMILSLRFLLTPISIPSTVSDLQDSVHRSSCLDLDYS